MSESKEKGINKAAVHLYLQPVGNETFKCKVCGQNRHQSYKTGFSNLVSHLESDHSRDWRSKIG